MEWFQMPENQVLEKVNSREQGISSEEAERRLKENGRNVLWERKPKKWFQVFIEQFQDLLVWILLAAAVVSALTDNGESAVVIGAVLTLNAALGTIEHQRAQKSLDSLRALSAPEARVLRDGAKETIPAQEVVQGDIILLETGDLVPADGRLLESSCLEMDESALTGESAGAEKNSRPLAAEDIPLASRKNMVYSGSLVTAGRGKAVVTAVGMDTEIGKIAGLMDRTEEKRTPLEVSLDRFSFRLAAGILAVCVVVFWLDIYRGESLLDAVMFAVALAVAAIPEALGSIVTIVQAMGTQKMARENGIVKDLKAVESLGCVSVICTDKTGTVTQKRMEAAKVFTGFSAGEKPFSSPEEKILWLTARLASNASKEGGSPTEFALYQGEKEAEKAGIIVPGEVKQYVRRGEIPFNSARKRMSVECRAPDGRKQIFAKGALESLLPCCRFMLEKGEKKEISGRDKEKLLRRAEGWSRQGMRVLAFACSREEGEQGKGESRENWERDLTFVGMIALADPLRPETKGAVAAAKEAGIQPVMITGDHPATAEAIAREAGILEEGQLTVTGPQLETMDDKKLSGLLEQIAVYARVTPEHKLRIVEAWQKKGRITAMTGDGVNDGPALKKADIGIAMGMSGTEVSKDAADLILADDNFATIIKAVANGRNVYRNIKNAIGFLLSGNMAGIFCVLYASLFALPMPFLPVHLLFINLVTDSLPALAIGMEPAQEDLLKQPPRKGKEGILTGNFVKDILFQGGLLAVSTMAAYHMGLQSPGSSFLPAEAGQAPAAATTMAFAVLTLGRLFHGFNCRSAHSILHIGLGTNLYSIMAFEAGTLLLAAVLFIDRLKPFFAVADLSLLELGAIVVLAALPTVLIQAQKMFREGRT